LARWWVGAAVLAAGVAVAAAATAACICVRAPVEKPKPPKPPGPTPTPGVWRATVEVYTPLDGASPAERGLRREDWPGVTLWWGPVYLKHGESATVEGDGNVMLIEADTPVFDCSDPARGCVRVARFDHWEVSGDAVLARDRRERENELVLTKRDARVALKAVYRLL